MGQFLPHVRNIFEVIEENKRIIKNQSEQENRERKEAENKEVKSELEEAHG